MSREENYQKLWAMVEAPIRIRQERIRRDYEKQNAREQKESRKMIAILIVGSWVVLAFYEYLLSGNGRFDWDGYLKGCFYYFCVWMLVLYLQDKGNKARLDDKLELEERDLEKLQRWHDGELPRFGVRTVEIQCPKNTNQLCYYDINADFCLIEKRHCVMCEAQNK